VRASIQAQGGAAAAAAVSRCIATRILATQRGQQRGGRTCFELGVLTEMPD
jgi:hypothetical protein